jgi:DNA-directed RNA polymerase specialized sigma24 family protein
MEKKMTIRMSKNPPIEDQLDVAKLEALSSMLAVMALRFCPSSIDAEDLVAETIHDGKTEIGQAPIDQVKPMLFKIMRRNFLSKRGFPGEHA